MSDRIDALYEAAQKATPGPWHIPIQHREDYGRKFVFSVGGPGFVAEAAVVRDATYLALADPQTIMALVEVYRAAQDIVPIEGFLDGMPDDYEFTSKRTAGAWRHVRAAIEKVEALGHSDQQREGV